MIGYTDSIDDRSYYAKRAREEREIAVVCENNSAAIVHLSLAEEYDRRATAGVPQIRTNSL
jgi:hypothetical protein